MMPKNTWLTRPVRILIMCTLITLFFIISPVVIFYTAGYRFDFGENQILQTGVISIDIEPRDARAVLNGVVINKRIPIRLTNRAPGNYTLLLEREGYHSWQEIITVNSKETTYIRDITLFANSLPVLLQSTEITETTDVIPSPYPQNTLLLHNVVEGVHEFGLYHVLEETYTPLLRTAAESLVTAAWSPYQTDLLLLQLAIDSDTVHSYLVHIQEQDISTPLISPTVPTYHWTGNDVYVLDETVWTNVETKMVVERDTNKLLPTNAPPETWFVRLSDTVFLDPRTSSTIRLDTPIDSIVTMNETNILATAANTLLHFSRTGSQATLQTTWEHATLASYGERYIITTPWEIFIVTASGKPDLLLRTSNQIKFVSLLDNNRPELIITHDGNIDVFEPRFNTITTLTKNTALYGAMSNSRQTGIYFYGEVGRQYGVFELAL